MKRKTKTAVEQDVASRVGRRVLHWRRGETAAIKTRMRRRERREARQELRRTEG